MPRTFFFTKDRGLDVSELGQHCVARIVQIAKMNHALILRNMIYDKIVLELKSELTVFIWSGLSLVSAVLLGIPV